MTKWFVAILGLIISTTAPKAHAAQMSSGFKFMPSLMYLYSNVQDTSTASGYSGSSRVLADGTFGLMFQNSPLFLGAVYSYDSTSNSGGTTDKLSYSSYGGSIGLVTENIYMIVSYLASSQLDRITSAGATLTYPGGNGFQFIVGYFFSIGQSTSIGPQLTYRNITYNQVKDNTGTTSSANYTYSTVAPYITLFFSL